MVVDWMVVGWKVETGKEEGRKKVIFVVMNATEK